MWSQINVMTCLVFHPRLFPKVTCPLAVLHPLSPFSVLKCSASLSVASDYNPLPA